MICNVFLLIFSHDPLSLFDSLSSLSDDPLGPYLSGPTTLPSLMNFSHDVAFLLFSFPTRRHDIGNPRIAESDWLSQSLGHGHYCGGI